MKNGRRYKHDTSERQSTDRLTASLSRTIARDFLLLVKIERRNNKRFTKSDLARKWIAAFYENHPAPEDVPETRDERQQVKKWELKIPQSLAYLISRDVKARRYVNPNFTRNDLVRMIFLEQLRKNPIPERERLAVESGL